MQLSRPFTKTASVTSHNLDFILPAFLQVLAILLLDKIRLYLYSLCPRRSNENLKTIAALSIILGSQVIVERSPLLQIFFVPGSQLLKTQLTKWKSALLDRLSSVLLQVHNRLHFLTWQIAQVAELFNGVETMFWLHPCSRTFEHKILRFKRCQTMNFFLFSLLQELVMPLSFDMLLRMRLSH
jgi:hypothetical protein